MEDGTGGWKLTAKEEIQRRREREKKRKGRRTRKKNLNVVRKKRACCRTRGRIVEGKEVPW